MSTKMYMSIDIHAMMYLDWRTVYIDQNTYQVCWLRYLRIKIWFFDIGRVMKPVDGAKIAWAAKRFL